MILDLLTGFSRSTSRSISKCRGGPFCCNYFQENFRRQRKDVKARPMLTTSDVSEPRAVATTQDESAPSRQPMEDATEKSSRPTYWRRRYWRAA
jgi:hypothetical protein